MNERYWKRIEKTIADIPNWAIQSASTTLLEDDGMQGFIINLRKLYDESDYQEEVINTEPLRCKLGFHKWIAWSDEEYNIHNILGVFQVRECLLCGKVERRSTI